MSLVTSSKRRQKFCKLITFVMRLLSDIPNDLLYLSGSVDILAISRSEE